MNSGIIAWTHDMNSSRIPPKMLQEFLWISFMICFYFPGIPLEISSEILQDNPPCVSLFLSSHSFKKDIPAEIPYYVLDNPPEVSSKIDFYCFSYSSRNCTWKFSRVSSDFTSRNFSNESFQNSFFSFAGILSEIFVADARGYFLEFLRRILIQKFL